MKPVLFLLGLVCGSLLMPSLIARLVDHRQKIVTHEDVDKWDALIDLLMEEQ